MKEIMLFLCAFVFGCTAFSGNDSPSRSKSKMYYWAGEVVRVSDFYKECDPPPPNWSFTVRAPDGCERIFIVETSKLPKVDDRVEICYWPGQPEQVELHVKPTTSNLKNGEVILREISREAFEAEKEFTREHPTRKS